MPSITTRPDTPDRCPAFAALAPTSTRAARMTVTTPAMATRPMPPMMAHVRPQCDRAGALIFRRMERRRVLRRLIGAALLVPAALAAGCGAQRAHAVSAP